MDCLYANNTSTTNINVGVYPLINVCRICLTNAESLVSLYGTNIVTKENQPISIFWYGCFGEEIVYDPAIPSNICNSCLLQVLNYYDFKKQYESAMLYFKRVKDENNINYNTVQYANVTYNNVSYNNTTTFIEGTSPSHSAISEEFVINEHSEELKVEGTPVVEAETETTTKPKVKHKKGAALKTDGDSPTKSPKTPKEKGAKRVKRPEKQLICTICDKLFRRAEYLDAHVNKHLGKTPYTCTICKKSFSGKFLLDKHVKIHERQKKEVECVLCSEMILEVTLKKHKRQVHGIGVKEKPVLKCNVCDKIFASQQLLEDHVNAHLGNKIHTCKTCSKSFTGKLLLRQHINNKHSDMRICL